MEKQKKKKTFWFWFGAATLVLENCYLFGKLWGLKKENQALNDKILDLLGQIHAVERENRRLGKEVENSYFQLGKKSVTK